MATVNDVILRARDLLADTKVPYRHSTAKLIRCLNDAFGDGYSIRPDLFLDAGMEPPEYDEGDLSTPWPVPTMYIPAFAQYVTSMAEFADDEFVSDGRATLFHKTFAAKLRGTPQ